MRGFFRYTRRSQPQAVTRPDQSGIARGTVVEFIPSLGHRNLANGAPLVPVGTPTQVGTVDGLAERFVRASTQGLSVGTDSAYNPADMTLMVIYTPALSSGGAGHTLFSRDDNTLGRAFTLDLHWNTNFGVRYYVAGGGTVGTNELREGVTATVGRRYVILATQTGNTAKLWVDGKLVASSASFTAKPSATGDTRIGIRTYSGSNEPCDGYMPLARMVNRAFSDAEAVQFFANPWQFLVPDAPLQFAAAVASGGNTVSPGTGHLVFTGYAPTVTRTANQTVPPGTGHLSFTGYAPTVSQTSGQIVTPGTGHLTLTGYQVSVTQSANQIVSPGKGHLAFTGYAPTVTQSNNQTVSPGKGHLSFTGYAPTVTQTAGQTVSPGKGHLSFTGYAPTVTQTNNQIVTPGTGHLRYTGYAPSVSNGGAVWPLPSQVLAGVVYGPTGVEYTGTLTGGGGAFLRRR